MRYFRNPNFISFCFLILIKPGCISAIPALGILDTLLNMIRIMLVLFTLVVLFKNAQLLPVNRLFGVTMLWLRRFSGSQPPRSLVAAALRISAR